MTAGVWTVKLKGGMGITHVSGFSGVYMLGSVSYSRKFCRQQE